MVEYERFGEKKMEKGGRMNEDIGWPAILSHSEDGGHPFSAPLLRKC